MPQPGVLAPNRSGYTILAEAFILQQIPNTAWGMRVLSNPALPTLAGVEKPSACMHLKSAVCMREVIGTLAVRGCEIFTYVFEPRCSYMPVSLFRKYRMEMFTHCFLLLMFIYFNDMN